MDLHSNNLYAISLSPSIHFYFLILISILFNCNRMLLVRSVFLLIYACLCLIGAASTEHQQQDKPFKIGVGIGDITGPPAEITFMGYADLSQTGKGILQRIFARAFIVANDDDRIVFVNSDTAAVGDIVKKRVVKKLQSLYGNKVYTEQNVMISSTHSHNGMGGYLQHGTYLFLG